MSVSYISRALAGLLWAKAGGICEYDGCTERLGVDPATKWEFNASYIAHIIADREGGPRGDRELSEELRRDISNLMLLCDRHHRLIDKIDVEKHTPDLLREMKKKHEDRIELLTSIEEERTTELLMYCANVGRMNAVVNYKKASNAILPDRYPASFHGISIGIKNSEIRDFDEVFWKSEVLHLERSFSEHVKPRIMDGSIEHLSIFAIAPQPLLMKPDLLTWVGRQMTQLPPRIA